MPKKTPWNVKEKWFDQVEEGKTIAQVSKAVKKDPRTVQDAVEAVRKHRQTSQITLELLKEGMKKHLQDLLDATGKMAESARPLLVHIDAFYSAVAVRSPLNLEASQVHMSGGQFDRLTLDIEENFSWPLLLEHLGRDRAVKMLERWKSAVLEELNARLTLREKVMAVLTEDLGLDIRDDHSQANTLRPHALHELMRSTFSHVLQEEPRYSVEMSSGENGEFFIGKDTGGRLPQDSSEFLDSLKALPMQLSEGPEARALLDSRKSASEEAEGVRKAFLEIRMSHYLSGKCVSCARHGF